MYAQNIIVQYIHIVQFNIFSLSFLVFITLTLLLFQFCTGSYLNVCTSKP